MAAHRNNSRRVGGVYIAVLGSAMIIALLGLCALFGQRIQNRLVVNSKDIRQAQLNASTAVELALLTMKQDTNWRINYANGNWFTNRGTGNGTCTVNVIDPVDSSLSNNFDDPVVITGIGFSAQAEQRVKVTIDARKEPLSCLRSAVATGNNITLNADTLRTGGLITANQVSASSSWVYGKVEAASATGSMYSTSPTVVPSEKRPTMPTWTSVFQYYRDNATAIAFGSLPTTTGNSPGYLGRNVSFDTDTNYWTATATGLPTAEITRETGVGGHTASLRVRNRTAITAGASQYISHFVKPGMNYTVTMQIFPNSSWGNVFRLKLATKGTGAVQANSSTAIAVVSGAWQDVSVTLAAPAWSGQLEYARVTVDTEHAAGSTNDFYIDNFSIRENTSGSFLYRQLLSPTNNPFGATNSQGIYKIDCGGQKLVIERSRIVGTLLIINPGAGSCVADGPINWAPAVPGHPALLVDADTASNANFSLLATNGTLNEADNEVNFNPAGVPFDFANSLCGATDTSQNDLYPSEIRGLIAIRNDLFFQNRPLVRGQVIVGNNINNSSGELEIDFQPESLLNPPPGFWAPYSYPRRPDSVQKAILP